MTKPIDISIIVTCHSEGVVLHKTLLSVYRSLSSLSSDIIYEIIVHADNPTQNTKDYLDRLPNKFSNIKVFTNSFKDPGASRNFCINISNGRYIALIDGDDLMSKNWLPNAYKELENHTYGEFIAHSAMTIEFGAINSIVQKYGEIDKVTDSLLNIWSARWNAVIFAPANILKKIGYPANRPGYGYEDWLISCDFISMNIHNIVIPETIIFVRRKQLDSVWNTQRSSMLLLPANNILSFDFIRSIDMPSSFVNENSKIKPTKKQIIKTCIKTLIQNTPIERYTRKILKIYRNLPQNKLPEWMMLEWKDIHSIEKAIFPTREIIGANGIYHSITPVHYKLGQAYKKLVDQTHFNKYDYILFVPWLISGGGDLFAINYANAICREKKDKRVLVIATMPNVNSTWQSKLDNDIDFITFGNIAGEMDYEHKNRLLEQFIENSGATHIHILNSILGYDFVKSHESYIKNTNKKIVVTSFSQSIDATGKTFGFSHTHVPLIYDLTNLITTDNQAVIDMWVSEYGFDANKIMLHNQPISLTSHKIKPHISDGIKIHVLWAARLAPEKLVQIVPKIGTLLEKSEITIDMYGTRDQGYNIDFLNNLPKNVTYCGSFNDFFSLPLQKYDIFLYTSLFDGMPNALLEASQAKLPIIASAVGGIPSFINEDNGILVSQINDPAAYAIAIEKLAEDPKLRSKIANNAYKKIRDNFSTEKYKKNIEKMLKRLNY